VKQVVIDASAAAPWVIVEETTPVHEQLYADVMESSGVFHAPALWIWETSNLLLVAMRRGRLTPDGLDTGLVLFADCPIEFDPAPDRHRRAQVMRLASVHNLSYYDAAYLELSLRLNSQLASSDRSLVTAAKACGIPCLDL
jgi:predicted nucleic acid-binding protein